MEARRPFCSMELESETGKGQSVGTHGAVSILTVSILPPLEPGGIPPRPHLPNDSPKPRHVPGQKSKGRLRRRGRTHGLLVGRACVGAGQQSSDTTQLPWHRDEEGSVVSGRGGIWDCNAGKCTGNAWAAPGGTTSFFWRAALAGLAAASSSLLLSKFKPGSSTQSAPWSYTQPFTAFPSVLSHPVFSTFQ